MGGCNAIKFRENSQVLNKAIYLADGLSHNGKKEVLGMWLGKNKSATFSISVLIDLESKGDKDILISVPDYLKFLPILFLMFSENIQTNLRYTSGKKLSQIHCKERQKRSLLVI